MLQIFPLFPIFLNCCHHHLSFFKILIINLGQRKKKSHWFEDPLTKKTVTYKIVVKKISSNIISIKLYLSKTCSHYL